MIEIIIVIAGIILDQLSKNWMIQNMKYMSKVIIPGVLQYSYVENTGAAFGMLSKNTILLGCFSVVMSAVFIFFLVKYRKSLSMLSRISLALIISGAIGNAIDRIMRGFVIDFIELLFVNFAIFNIADICITMGAIFLGISIIFIERHKASS
ncbi:MAG: signal peptidase II [Clostridia bacterium]|jgi:signal peptidase II|nr:signal peptidase II [Clostridia bacterium]MBQ6004513.1 signal peptidase II [Clostridia bacterium]MBR0438153.1 signal peptidase II [Clostridia bacterium]MBR3563470.1 signal peptidase II [Clostridia bacterium]MBR6135973.1 signal peptidase II [Clostridia bacterium]